MAAVPGRTGRTHYGLPSVIENVLWVTVWPLVIVPLYSTSNPNLIDAAEATPAVKFDPASETSDVTKAVEELLQLVQDRTLTAEEAEQLATAWHAQPWLEWAGKREQSKLLVDPIAIQIHEHVEAKSVLRIATRQDVEANLFGDPKLEYQQAVEFYKHEVDWRNRLILGDSLQVMASLAQREDLAGKVQIIYIDPPYGIKFASNFQPEVGKRDVKDKEQDLTREPEMVKAFRDTWHLGIHSYLSYLRDRLITAKELLADNGSVLVQIGEENLHRVRNLLDEVFGSAQAVVTISFKSAVGLGSQLIDPVVNYIVWYCADIEKIRYRPLYRQLVLGGLSPRVCFRWPFLRQRGIARTAVGRIEFRRGATRASGGRRDARAGFARGTPLSLRRTGIGRRSVELRGVGGRAPKSFPARQLPVLQLVLPEADHQRAAGTLLDDHPAAALSRVDRLQQLEVPIVEPHHVVVAHHPLALDRQDRLQPVARSQTTVTVRCHSRGLREPPVVLGHQRLQQRVRPLAGLRLRQPQLLHPAILGRAERSLHTPLRMRAVRPDQLDAQLVQSPAELDFRVGIGQWLPLLVRFENAVPVGVERVRTTVLPQPNAEQIQVRFDCPVPVELRQDPARRVVDHSDQHDRLAAAFEPVVDRRVHLHQLAEAATPRAKGIRLTKMSRCQRLS